MTPDTLSHLQQLSRRASDRAFAYRAAGSPLAREWQNASDHLELARRAMMVALHQEVAERLLSEDNAS